MCFQMMFLEMLFQITMQKSESTGVWPSGVITLKCKSLCKRSSLSDSLWHTRDHIIMLNTSNKSVISGHVTITVSDQHICVSFSVKMALFGLDIL